MEQLSLMDELFPKPKERVNDYPKFKQWLDSGEGFANVLEHQDAKMFHQFHNNAELFFGDLEQEKKDLIEFVKSKTFHHFQENDGLIKSIYSFKRKYTYTDTPKGQYEVDYIRVYRVGDRQLIQRHGVKDVLNEDVIFAAMCIDMVDGEGNKIHFSNREDFIMEDLGFEHHGVIRDKIFGNERIFCTLKSSISNIVDYWQQLKLREVIE